MATPFRYVPRSAEDLSKRENQKGSGFIGFIKDEFKVYAPQKENWIRFLPPTWEGARHYGMDVWVHYDVGPNGATVLCPQKMKNKPCPMCELDSQAEARGEESDFFPTKRVIAWIRDCKDEKATTPVVYNAPWTVDRDIAKICRDRVSGELYYIDDPENGYNVSFDKEGEGLKTKYTGYQIDRRPSPLEESFLKVAIEHPIPDVFIWRTYAEIKELYSGEAAEEEKPAPARTTELVKEDPRVERVRTTIAPPSAPTPEPEAPRARMTETGFCTHGTKVKGVWYYCGFRNGHTGDCDFVREGGEPVSTAPAPVVETPAPAAPAISSRAAELRAKLGR